MPEMKPHLQDVFRTSPYGDSSRRQYLRLDMNENVDGLPEEFIRDSLTALDAQAVSSYPDYRPIIFQIAKHNQIQQENICISNGSDAAIKYIFDAFISPGDRVLLTDPTFAMYPVYCSLFQANSAMVTYHNDFSFPYERFMEHLVPDVRLAVIINPNNPTGSVLLPEQIIYILKRCEEHDVILVVDEAYFYFYDKTCIQLVNQFNNLIVLRTFSKLCGLASLRLGYAAGCPEIIEALTKVKPTFDVNGIAAIVGRRVLENPQIIRDQIRAIREGKMFLKRWLDTHGFEYRAGKANFVLIRCPGKVNDIVKGLADQNILVSGGFTQAFLNDYIRVTVGNRESMRQFCDVFLAMWKELYGSVPDGHKSIR